MVNSNVPHLRSLVSVSCIEIIVQVKTLIMSSVWSNKNDASVVSVVRTELLQTRSFELNGEIVQLQSALNDDKNNFSGNIKHVPHFKAQNWKIFPKPFVLLRSLQISFIDSFSSAMERCNTSEGFGAFFGQSCDRDRFLFPFISLFFSLSWFYSN